MLITTQRDLAALCRDLAGAPSIGLDTEFVSEHSFRPQLCLVQVAVGDRLIAIDPLAELDLVDFWDVMSSGTHETIVHAGREELMFCLAAVGRPLAGLFDVQIAAGLIGQDYPAGYSSLIWRLLGVTPEKGETRTDWRRRPLSTRQVEYALDDVRHLSPLKEKIGQRLDELGRRDWVRAEMAAFQSDVSSWQSGPRWRRVTGSSGLSRRSQAIVRELWQWREAESERRNCPVRRVLRDDLIVELAKRRMADPKHIAAIRGLERGDLQRSIPALSRAITKALQLPESECPQVMRREENSQLSMLGQFLASALNSICRSASVAPSLVGTVADVRELVAHRLDPEAEKVREPPVLTQGWRAQVVGRVLDDLLAGKLAIRVADPHSDEPLAFEPAG